MGRIGGINPYTLGGAFVERALEAGWLEREQDGRKTTYYLTADGYKQFDDMGINLNKVLIRNSSRPEPGNGKNPAWKSKRSVRG